MQFEVMLMTPHCDNMEGPVVKAAELALEMENINYVLPFVKEEFEHELKDAFAKTMEVRELSGEAAELADYWFFETAVRLHRLGEGAPYTGLKSAGLDWGPVISRADMAIETEDLDDLRGFLLNFIGEELERRFRCVIFEKDYELNDIVSARAYVNSMLDFVLFSHNLYRYVESCGED
jgi:hypothetical protein